MTGHILLLDASGFAHRAFHAGNKSQFRSDGLPTWAITGFLSMVWSLLQRAQADKPTHGAAIFDFPGKTFRHKLYPDYKGHRSPAKRKELNPQLPYLRHAANALGFEALEFEGFEADDVIATIARRAMAIGIRTTIVSSDKDFCQLVKDDHVEIIDPLSRTRVLRADVIKKFGAPPELVPDVQALWGDDVDNIPGLDGIGGKGAGKLISQFGSLEALLEAAGASGRVVGTPATRKVLRRDATKARLWKDLATLRNDVPIEFEFHRLLLHPPEGDHLKEMLRALECSHKYDVMFTRDLSVTIKVPTNPAPLSFWAKAVKTPQPRYPDEPQDGYYKCRLIRGGPWVPGRIWREPERDFATGRLTGMDVVSCEVAGKPRNPRQQWNALARYPISKADYDYLVSVGNWARDHAPNSSEANPGKPVNWLVEPIE